MTDTKEIKEENVFPFIEGESINLNSINLEHIELYAKLMNSPKCRKYARFNVPQTIEEVKKSFEPTKQEVKDNIFFEIWQKIDKKAIGLIGFNRIQWFARSGMITCMVEQEFWGKGIATEAVKLIVDYGFKELNLHKITARILSPDKASIRITEKLGFKHEITHKKEIFVDGEHVDTVNYIIFKADWIKA